jgi:hypothetical protein
MQKKETAPVTISRYAEKILYLQLKYGDTDFTGICGIIKLSDKGESIS